jgi:hypothetical protein
LPSVALAEPQPEVLQGSRQPRILWEPPFDPSDLGAEAVGLAADVGLVLDPWEADFLAGSLRERAGKWAAFEVAGMVSRQNGKGAILEAREIAGLFLLDEQLILHSAHEYKTAAEGFRRLLGLVENCDMLRRRVRQVRTSHGEEGLELLNGARLRFIARSTGSGRGFTGDCVILDEAQNLPDAAVDALMPTMSARPNPQLWYTFTAPDKDLAPCGHIARVRRRGIKGGDRGLYYAEWSINPHVVECSLACTEHDDPASPRSWARANPGLNIRISETHVGREMASMSAQGFARERLGVGNWPVEAGAGWQVIAEEQWTAREDRLSQVLDPVAVAMDATPFREWGSIAVAGRRADGNLHVEVVEHRPRTSWMVPWLLDRIERLKPCAVVIDGASEAGSLIAPLEAASVEVVKPTFREMAQACGQLVEAVTDSGTLRHLGQVELAVALAGAQKRPLGDSWAWSRRDSSVDISPLVASTLALWGHATRAHIKPETLPPPDIF